MHEFPQTLKTWRKTRRFSQLDLAAEADVSPRHLSFLESGRSKPSREMIDRLCEALQMPLDARNQMLTHAGFAVRYPGRKWENEEMAPIRKAVELTLSHHLPFPGLAVDRLWTVRRMNDAARHIYGLLGVEEGDSLLDLMMSEDLPPLIENWEEVSYHAAARLRTESVAQGGVPQFDNVINYLSSFSASSGKSPEPVVPTILKLGGSRLSIFSTLLQFGTPEDVTLDDMKIELYFPMDDHSDALLRSFANT